jgi:hypothetical protein
VVTGQNLGGHWFMLVGNSESVFTIQYMCVMCYDCHVPQFLCHRLATIYKSNEQNMAKRSGEKVKKFENTNLFCQPQNPNAVTFANKFPKNIFCTISQMIFFFIVTV